MVFENSVIVTILFGIFSMLAYIARLIYNIGSKITSFDLRLAHLENNQKIIIKDIEKIESKVYQ